MNRSWIFFISGWRTWSFCIDFTDRKVSGRISRRIVNVSRMIPKPQLFSPPPNTSSAQNFRIASEPSMMGCSGLEAMISNTGISQARVRKSF